MSAPNVLLGKIEGFTRKFYLNRLIQGVLVGAVLWIVFFLLVNGLEYFSWFSPKGRFVLFLLLLVGSAFVLVYYFIIPLINLIRFRKKMSTEQAAVMIGKFFPDIKDKLLNTLQLSESLENDADNALLLAAIEQRTAKLSPVRFSDAVDLRGNLKYLAAFFGLLLLLIVLVIFFPKFAVLPAQRIVNYEQIYEKPLPYQVTMNWSQFEAFQGEDVPLEISISGERIPDAFYVKSSLGQQLMTRQAPNSFSYTFKNLYEDLVFQVIGGEYISQPLHIVVHPNPVLLSYECALHYPNYVHRESETLTGKTRLIVPQGTRMDFRFFTRYADTVFVVVDSVKTLLPLSDDCAHYQWVASRSGKFDLFVCNAWNSKMTPLSFHFDVLPDAYPDIQVKSFEEPLSSDHYFSGLVTDDYGFSKLTFNCLIKQPVERNIVTPVVLDLRQTRTSFFYHFNMDSLGVLPGQDMEVYFEVWDNDGFHGPKSKRSETFTFYKASESALDSIADQTAEDIMERLSQKSQEANKLQDDIEKMLQELIQKKDLDWSDKEKIKDLMERQNAVQEEWDKLQKEQHELSDFMKDHDIANEDLLKKQEQINKLFDEVIPDEMKKMMEEIQSLLEQMPRDQMQQMLRDIKQNNQQMQELLDRNLSLLEQLKMEKDLNDLADKLNKLGDELKNQEQENTDRKSADEAKSEFEDMMKEFDQLLEKNKDISQPFNVDKDEALQDEIEQDLDKASQSEKSGNQQQSQQNKQKAGENMQKMANDIMMDMQMMGMEQMAEDAQLVRILLENVVHASHQQEALMKELGQMRPDDPSLTEKIISQKEISDNFDMVRDSLRNMAMRQPTIKNYVFDELHTIENQTELAMQYMNDLHLSNAVRNQQTAMMSMNNLALMLAESLDDMKDSMNPMNMPMNSMQSKPGQSCSNPGMQQMQQMQQKLGEQLKQLQQQMQQGKPGSNSMSEQFARMAAEQEMLRQGMQQMLQEMKENGQLGDDGLNDIIKDMEKLEEDLVNKTITHQTLQRNQQILSRMLESQKAQEKRDRDEQRKSNEFRGSQFDRTIDDYIYQQSLKKSQEFLRKNPIEFSPYYKSKINEYYLRKNTR